MAGGSPVVSPDAAAVRSAGAQIPWAPRPDGCCDVLWRHAGNPLVGTDPVPDGNSVYNSAVVAFENRFAGVFRVDHRDLHPKLHLAWSDDGLEWDIQHEPIQFRDETGAIRSPNYAYDPRVTRIGNEYVIAWCNDFHGPTVALARTENFRDFRYLGNAFPPFNRNGVLFPRRINGLYTMLHRPSDGGHTSFGSIFLSQSPDLEFWGRHEHVMDPGSAGWWDAVKVGAGPVPIETDEGWLVLYHGVVSTCNGFHYSIGSALLDLEDPGRVIARCGRYLLYPQATYEIVGRVPNVCFPCAALVDDDTGRLALYYGAADTCVALAFGQLSEIIEYTKTHNCVRPA
jgi:beta-1,4-mannooligosaccharide/beta-1,4-mannosyl-N-acetylglucosamine phosphorylase